MVLTICKFGALQPNDCTACTDRPRWPFGTCLCRPERARRRERETTGWDGNGEIERTCRESRTDRPTESASRFTHWGKIKDSTSTGCHKFRLERFGHRFGEFSFYKWIASTWAGHVGAIHAQIITEPVTSTTKPQCCPRTEWKGGVPN